MRVDRKRRRCAISPAPDLVMPPQPRWSENQVHEMDLEEDPQTVSEYIAERALGVFPEDVEEI